MTDYPFVILSDTGADLPAAYLEKWGVQLVPMSFRFEGVEKEYIATDLTTADFYSEMRNGKVAKTAGVNIDDFTAAMEQILQQGKDFIYIGFSSALSSTYNCGRMAVNALKEKYPDRKMYAVDGLCASAGQSLLLYLVCNKRKEGADVGETARFAEEIRLNVCHWFTVDDLVYLKRGGRISATSAFVGNLLGIKPVLHMDEGGRLVPVSKARGRRGALAAMAAKYKETAQKPSTGHVFISHGDCLADAELLASMLREQTGVEVELFADIGPAIGAHSGPGTLALFFVGTIR